MGSDRGERARGFYALSGTPGTGKSSVARALPPALLGVELADLSYGFGGRAAGRFVTEVDLPALARFVRRARPSGPVVLAGHLAHRLPVRGIAVLRCHPARLARRLRARPLSDDARRDNVVCEAIDLLAAEARGTGRPVVEIDTTDLRPEEVGRRLARWIGGTPSDEPPVNWLADPSVPPLLSVGVV